MLWIGDSTPEKRNAENRGNGGAKQKNDGETIMV
jgi:hypothetical protein